MANEIQEVEAGARINHPVYRDVYNTTFDKDVLTDIEMDSDGNITGVCETAKYGQLPVFYHCKRNCYSSDVGSLQGDGSLKNGILAFAVEDEVQVLLEEGIPKYIVGHTKMYNPPRMCEDILKITYSKHSGASGECYFVCSEPAVLEDGVDFYGDVPVCKYEGKVIWIKTYPGEPYYKYDQGVLIKIGPVLYYIRTAGQWYGDPEKYSYGGFWVGKQVWTQEKEDECIAAGAAISSGWEPPWDIDWDGLGFVHIEAFDDMIYWEIFTTYPDPFEEDGLNWTTLKFYGQGEKEEEEE